ncbi:MAG TPA: BON domain-containing protein [Vicinamibacterales bacterium]|nr:BON domain-containing protein [Vicinamibacterales bacterium]
MLDVLPTTDGAAVRHALLKDIDSDPAIRESEVGVAAEDGLVTLTGCVRSRGVKVAAERAAKRIPGVRIIANDLQVNGGRERSDTDIARDALHCLRNNWAVPASVQAVVCDGFITLDGTVSDMHQRLEAERAVKHIQGVAGVNNDITLEIPRRPLVEARVEGRPPWHA